MFVDSHCHLSFPELRDRLPQILAEMQLARVQGALCICTTMEEFATVQGLAAGQPHLWASVGVHPDTEGLTEPTVDDLVRGAGLPKVVAIGETGLDYYRLNGRSIADMEWQRERFRTHIRAAGRTDLPLVIHTRSSSDDTLRVLKEEGASGAAPACCYPVPDSFRWHAPRWILVSTFRCRASSASAMPPICARWPPSCRWIGC